MRSAQDTKICSSIGRQCVIGDHGNEVVSPDFPEKLPAKLKAILERYDLTLADPLKSLDAATIEAYENGDLECTFVGIRGHRPLTFTADLYWLTRQ